MEDARTLMDAVGRVYDAALSPDAETLWMELLRDSIGPEHAVLTEAAHGNSRAWYSEVDEDLHPLVRRLSDTTIYDPSLSRMPARTACRMTDYFPLRELMRHDVYHEIVRPLHGGYALAFVWTHGAGRTAIAICRDAHFGMDYSDGEIARFQPLLQHLHNAMRVRRRIAVAEAEAGHAHAALEAVRDGVVIVDGRGAVRFANRAARAILGEGDALACDRNGLRAVAAAEDRKLRRLVGNALAMLHPRLDDRRDAAMRRPERIAIARPQPKRPLFVAAAPAGGILDDGRNAGASIVLLLTDPERQSFRDAGLLMDAYGLTMREAQLAIALGDGGSLALSAARLGIAEGTARQYLKRVFAKIGVARQAELVGLLRTLD